MKQKAIPIYFPRYTRCCNNGVSIHYLFCRCKSFFCCLRRQEILGVGRTSAVEYTEAQIKQLQGALKITDAQKELWNNLTQVMRENAKEMDALTKDRTEKTMTMNAVEQMKFRVQISQAHLDQLKKFIPPFEALYDSMSDKQKKDTDTIFLTGRHGKNRMH